MPPTWITQKCRTKLRVCRKWIRSVRFTPEGSKKERCADLMHLAHFADLADFGDFGDFAFGGCTEYNVAGRGRAHITLPAEAEESELRTQDSGLRPQNSELRTQNSGLRTQNSELRTQDSELSTQDSGLRTQTRKIFYARGFVCKM